MLKIESKVYLVFATALFLAACNSDGTSNEGAGQTSGTSTETTSTAATETTVEPNLTAAVVGPNLNGSEWVGYLKSEADGVTNLTATVLQEGNQITIVTSKDGIAHEFKGTISPAGALAVMDQFDGENWSTYYGNVSTNSINLADLIVMNGRNVDINILILKR